MVKTKIFFFTVNLLASYFLEKYAVLKLPASLDCLRKVVRGETEFVLTVRSLTHWFY